MTNNIFECFKLPPFTTQNLNNAFIMKNAKSQFSPFSSHPIRELQPELHRGGSTSVVSMIFIFEYCKNVDTNSVKKFLYIASTWNLGGPYDI